MKVKREIGQVNIVAKYVSGIYADKESYGKRVEEVRKG